MSGYHFRFSSRRVRHHRIPVERTPSSLFPIPVSPPLRKLLMICASASRMMRPSRSCCTRMLCGVMGRSDVRSQVWRTHRLLRTVTESNSPTAKSCITITESPRVPHSSARIPASPALWSRRMQHRARPFLQWLQTTTETQPWPSNLQQSNQGTSTQTSQILSLLPLPT